MANPRAGKLADQIRVIAAEMLERRIKDPRLGFVTVTEVRVTGDSRDATIFYTVLGTEADAASSAAALKSATGLIRSRVAKDLGMKFAPSITFVPDALPDTAREMEDLLARAKAQDEALAAGRAGKSFAGDEDPYKHPQADADGSSETPADEG